MNNLLRKITAFVFAALTALIIPLSAFATVYSGGINGINYVAHVGESKYKIKSDISTDSSAMLKLQMFPVIYANSDYGWEMFPGSPVTEGPTNTNYSSVSFTFTTYKNTYLSGLTLYNGWFIECDYTTKINGTTVVTANEVF